MWKRAKLVTLVLVTVLLASLTYPTWRGLVLVESSIPWTSDDTIALVVPEGSSDSVNVTIGTYIDYQGTGEQSVTPTALDERRQ